jgi:hypothetical protein
LLIEHNGPWPHDALGEAPMPEETREFLLNQESKVLLIRRPDRQQQGVQGFYATPEGIRSARFQDLSEIAESDPRAWPEVQTDLYMVCTQGKRDACCAQFGRPVVEALAKLRPEETWEVSHLGGHRFAANVVALPSGDVFGRVTPDDVPALLDADPRLMRGTSWLSPQEQAEALLSGPVNEVVAEPGRVSCRDTATSPLTSWQQKS